MCGRFGFDIPAPRVAEHYELAEVPELAPRYNVAPAQPVAVVLLPAAGGGRVLRFPRWGLLPAWAEDERLAARTINARAETLADKPAFRAAFRKRRCLIPATGYYEWGARPDGGRQPHLIRHADEAIMTFAGLWESRPGPDGTELLTCTVITVPAAPSVAAIHHRMPALLDRADHAAWLAAGQDEATALLVPHAGPLAVRAVSSRVNAVSNDDPTLFDPAPVQLGLPLAP